MRVNSRSIDCGLYQLRIATRVRNKVKYEYFILSKSSEAIIILDYYYVKIHCRYL